MKVAMRRALLCLAALLPVVLGGGGPAGAQELTLSVAISMKDAAQEVGRRFAETRPGLVLYYNFGSSGALGRQIAAGAPADLFISAAEPQMGELERQRLILPETRRDFARNILTVVKPADSRLDLSRPEGLLEPRVRKVTLGNPRTVPAGQYAEESLRSLGLWERIQPKLVFAENVRQALEYVARGEVDAGFVYTTDAAVRGSRVKEAFRVPEDSYRPIVYPVAVVAGSKHPELGRAFIEFLVGREGRAVLSRFGFGLPGGKR